MNRSTLVGVPVQVLLVVVTAIVAVTTTAPALAADCVTVHMQAPFRLPDGMLYPAGVLTLCDSRTYSPVHHMHKILVGGSNVGVFVSRRRYAEAQLLGSPEILFQHGTDGILDLIGYTVMKSGRSIAYRLKNQALSFASAQAQAGGGAAASVGAIVATAASR